MKIKFFYLLALIFVGVNSLQSAQTDLLNSNKEPTQILINNRILAKVNGKAISTYDVAKKMDILFYKQYPQYISSMQGRYEYYQFSWRSVLDELIHKELIIADAAEHKIEVTSGDIRQEMESSFGPNIIANLDKVGMSFDEAAKIMKGDIIINRMLGFRANAKALRNVTPTRIKQAYDAYISDPKNIRQDQWRYQVVTIKDKTPQKTEETANKVYQLINEEKIPLNQLIATLKDKKLMGRKTKVTVSAEIVNNDNELSESYKKIISKMQAGMVSQPSLQKSKVNNSNVYRIFYVLEKISGGVPSYNELENKLKEKLLNEEADKETDEYLARLRQHFRVRDQDLKATIPDDYQPFYLR